MSARQARASDSVGKLLRIVRRSREDLGLVGGAAAAGAAAGGPTASAVADGDALGAPGLGGLLGHADTGTSRPPNSKSRAALESWRRSYRDWSPVAEGPCRSSNPAGRGNPTLGLLALDLGAKTEARRCLLRACLAVGLRPNELRLAVGEVTRTSCRAFSGWTIAVGGEFPTRTGAELMSHPVLDQRVAAGLGRARGTAPLAVSEATLVVTMDHRGEVSAWRPGHVLNAVLLDTDDPPGLWVEKAHL